MHQFLDVRTLSTSLNSALKIAFLDYTGWVYTIAMIFTGTSGNLRSVILIDSNCTWMDWSRSFSVALYLASLAEVGQDRTLTRVEIAAIAWGVNIASGIINTIGTKAIGGMSTFNVWWTLGGTFVLVITLLVKAPVKVRQIFLRFLKKYILRPFCRIRHILCSPTLKSKSYSMAIF